MAQNDKYVDIVSVTQEKLFVCFVQCLVFIHALIDAFQMEKQVIDDESGKQNSLLMAPAKLTEPDVEHKQHNRRKEGVQGFKV